MSVEIRNRWVCYLVGMLLLALGLTLNTKSGLGVSPIISVAFCTSRLLELNFGDMTFLLYVLFVAAQFWIRGKDRRMSDLLQIPLSLVFSRVLNLYDAVIPYDSAEAGFVSNLVVLLAAVLLTGIGVSMTVNMRLVPNPGDELWPPWPSGWAGSRDWAKMYLMWAVSFSPAQSACWPPAILSELESER